MEYEKLWREGHRPWDELKQTNEEKIYIYLNTSSKTQCKTNSYLKREKKPNECL